MLNVQFALKSLIKLCMENEEKFFDKEGLVVKNRQVIVRSKQFSLDEVSAGFLLPDDSWKGGLIMLGIGLCFWFFGSSFWTFLIGVALLVGGYFLWKSGKDTLIISTHDGQSHEFEFDKKLRKVAREFERVLIRAQLGYESNTTEKKTVELRDE